MINSKESIVLMADDDDDDCILAQEAMAEITPDVMLYCVEDGIKLMSHLRSIETLPSLILLDLNMPGKDGRQALKEIKSIRSLQEIPIVIFTTSQEEKDIAYSRNLGANSFITKPAQFNEWVKIMKLLTRDYLLNDKDPGGRTQNKEF